MDTLLNIATTVLAIVAFVAVYRLNSASKKGMTELRRLHHEANLALEAAVATAANAVDTLSTDELESEPFVTFPCTCGVQQELHQVLGPGQAAVINCDNCQTSHSIYLPPIQIHPTEKFDLVWPFTKNEGVKNEPS